MHIKAKTLHFFCAKKLKIVQNQEKAFGVSCNLRRGFYFENRMLYQLYFTLPLMENHSFMKKVLVY